MTDKVSKKDKLHPALSWGDALQYILEQGKEIERLKEALDLLSKQFERFQQKVRHGHIFGYCPDCDSLQKAKEALDAAIGRVKEVKRKQGQK